ncbi:hypothetical protein PMALA_069930 [Plasmodium malariae]|uniref:Uncharacterized protein n=1 Tax=Plasmodium malariae TaxID=5858 RepID=A0A1A8X6N1_PLAMA|nr:hypothetical protein PMALA_069930 [Plasmodium malariae]
MMIVEDSKKEDFIENQESHLDSSINDLKTEINLERKSDVTKEIIKVNGNVLENNENRQIRAYIGEKSFSQEVEDWINEVDIPENSIYNENSVE